MTNVGEKGAGREVLVCPECLTLLPNAGPGRALCSGQPGNPEHPETEMERYARGVGEQRSVPPPYGDVVAERQRQDAKWGGPEHDDQHSPDEWLGFIQEKWAGAHESLTADEYRYQLVQIAALAVAAIESLDRKMSADW